MKSDRIGKHVIIVFLLALILYIGSFRLIEYFRHVKGGWEVTFQTDAEARPSIRVSQQRLNISNVVFGFPDLQINNTNSSQTVVFNSPITNIPFGRVIFLDTTFLPGTVTVDLFGHEIELLPRVLVVNKKEVPWQSGMKLELLQKDKLQPPKKP